MLNLPKEGKHITKSGEAALKQGGSGAKPANGAWPCSPPNFGDASDLFRALACLSNAAYIALNQNCIQASLYEAR
jgi:hypothetical protein